MARIARVKLEGAWTHVHARVGGVSGEYLLDSKECRRKLLDIIRHYSGGYCCDVASVCVMGNHWHGIFNFEQPREMSDDELIDRAKLLYPNSKKLLADWVPAKWDFFKKRLFDISEFMRNVQSSFAQWYNKKNGRRGRFWADRFKSTVLGDVESLLDCMLYVDLNPVRAGIVRRPEDFEGSSVFLRDIGEDKWLFPLSKVIGGCDDAKALIEYKSLLYYRGNIKTKENQSTISNELLEKEKARGFKSKGVYAKRARYFTDGVIIGGDELVRNYIDKLKEKGFYLRRKNPIPIDKNGVFSLRGNRKDVIVE